MKFRQRRYFYTMKVYHYQFIPASHTPLLLTKPDWHTQASLTHSESGSPSQAPLPLVSQPHSTPIASQGTSVIVFQDQWSVSLAGWADSLCADSRKGHYFIEAEYRNETKFVTFASLKSHSTPLHAVSSLSSFLFDMSHQSWMILWLW